MAGAARPSGALRCVAADADGCAGRESSWVEGEMP